MGKGGGGGVETILVARTKKNGKTLKINRQYHQEQRDVGRI